ncbi:MAG: hypothetical protein WD638_05330 [Nitriliruptoraceae bacterium]
MCSAALDRHADVLLAMIASVEQQEVRWHLAPLVAGLELGPSQAEQVADQLEDYLDDSQIVRVTRCKPAPTSPATTRSSSSVSPSS